MSEKILYHNICHFVEKNNSPTVHFFYKSIKTEGSGDISSKTPGFLFIYGFHRL